MIKNWLTIHQILHELGSAQKDSDLIRIATDLGAKLLIDPKTVTTYISQLVSGGFLHADEYSLTWLGQDLYETLSQEYIQYVLANIYEKETQIVTLRDLGFLVEEAFKRKFFKQKEQPNQKDQKDQKDQKE